MKILIVVHHFPPHISGVGNVAQKQAEYLVKNGFEVTVITSDCSGSAGVEYISDSYKVCRVKALNFLENRVGAPFPIFSPSLLWQMHKYVKETDIVHAHDATYISSFLGSMFARLLKKPLFVTQHITIVEHPNKLAMIAQKLIHKSSGKFVFNTARKIIVYNVIVKKFLINDGVEPAKIILNYNGINTKYFSPISDSESKKLRLKYHLPTNKPIILFVGRLVHKKGFDLVFESRSAEYLTLIVGNGKIPEYMKNVKNVVFYGPATPTELRDLYRVSDVFVLPTVGEVFTLVMQEAMACGLPIITTKETAYSEYNIFHRLIGFTDRNSIDISNKIREILHNDKIRKKMCDYSRYLSEKNFSWEKNYSVEIKIYDSLNSRISTKPRIRAIT